MVKRRRKIYCSSSEIPNPFMKKKVLILGITGQDGSYLAELLLKKKYEVHGLIRRSATGNTKNIQHILNKIQIQSGDLADTTSLFRIIKDVNPHEIYNEADQDHAGWSYNAPDYSSDITGAAVGRILEIIRLTNKKIRYFQPLTSNMFGKTDVYPQNELTPLRPQSPYACAKAYAWMLTRYYRDVHGIFASCGIFYNHESPRRTDSYVTHKITKAVARISKGLQKKLILGDIDTPIDFGYAKEYVEAIWNILQLDKPDDYVIGTGEAHTVREFMEEAFRLVGLDAYKYVVFDKSLHRPGTTSTLIADYSKAKKAFGFSPKTRYKSIVKLLLDHDLKELS